MAVPRAHAKEHRGLKPKNSAAAYWKAQMIRKTHFRLRPYWNQERTCLKITITQNGTSSVSRSVHRALARTILGPIAAVRIQLDELSPSRRSPLPSSTVSDR